MELLIPQSDGAMLASIRRKGKIIREKYESSGVRLEAELGEEMAKRILLLIQVTMAAGSESSPLGFILQFFHRITEMLVQLIQPLGTEVRSKLHHGQNK